jgi:hypothetical protein
MSKKTKDPKSVISGRLSAQENLNKNIDRLSEIRIKSKDLLSNVEKILSGGGADETTKYCRDLKSVAIPHNPTEKKMFLLINEAVKAIQFLQSKKDAEIAELRTLKTNINEFVKNTIQDNQSIPKYQETKGNQIIGAKRKTEMASLFRLNVVKPGTLPSKLFKKKRKKDI